MFEIGSEPAVVLDCRINLGECPLWDERSGRLLWVNIHAGEVWSWNPFTDDPPQTIILNERIGAIALRREQGLLLALERGFAQLDSIENAPRALTAIEEMPSDVRLNDGRVDPAGRFVCGGMHEGAPQRPLASLYTFEAPARLARLLDGIHCTNSLCWSPDGATMYFTDMPSRLIEAFDYDDKIGTISNRRPFANLGGEPGFADGSVVDAEGYLWNAQWGGSKIVRYTPDGRIDREIALPVTNPTCLAFGGPDLDILFVTSAWFGLDDRTRRSEPQAGSILAFRPGVKGCREARFAG